jgi:hypothetical protein
MTNCVNRGNATPACKPKRGDAKAFEQAPVNHP